MGKDGKSAFLFRARKRAQKAVSVIGLEDIVVELRDPLLALNREFEISQRRTKIGLNTRPEKLWIMLYQVHWRLIAKPLRDARLNKFMEKTINFAMIEWIG